MGKGLDKEYLLMNVLDIKKRKELKLAEMKAKGEEGSIDYSVLEVEIEDADYLLKEDFSDKSIENVISFTTSGSLYDLLKDCPLNGEA